MILFLVALIPVSVALNILFYEYRVIKRDADEDIISKYSRLQFIRRYK